jgi:ABC-type multidrug transport system fused ATPase/permease subunit
MRKIIFLLFILLLLLPIVQAQETQGPVVPDWVRTLSGWWLIFLFAAFFLLAMAYIVKGTTGRSLMILAVILLFVGIIFALVGVLLPLFGTPTVTYEKCATMFKPDVSLLTFPGITYTTSCILTGYAPTGLEWLTVTTFVIFGIILPLGLLITLFWEFVPEGLIRSTAARRVIAVIAALFAFRGFFATFFVEMLSYGFAGVGALAVAVLFTGFVWKIAYSFVTPLGVPIKAELRYFALGEAEEIKREIGELIKAKTALEEEGKPTKDIEDRINRLTKRLEELEKKGK